MARLNRPHRRSPAGYLPALMVAGTLALASLGLTVRAHALPAEARTTETWYAYRQAVGFDFAAEVRPGRIYPAPAVRPDQLARLRLPGEPPAYRRILFGRLTEALHVRLPLTFKGDRPGDIQGRVAVDGQLVVPNLWQRPYPITPARELRVQGTELADEVAFTVPVTAIWAELDAIRKETGVMLDNVELRLQPVLEVDVGGQKEPVQARLAPEYRVVFRGSGALEVDEPREAREEKALQETRTVPVTVQVWGMDLPAGTLRRLSLAALGVTSLGALAVVVAQRRRRGQGRPTLDRLGAGLVSAEQFEPPPGAAVVDVSSEEELLRLHLQTERPVIRAAGGYYLVDGTTCYRRRRGGP